MSRIGQPGAHDAAHLDAQRRGSEHAQRDGDLARDRRREFGHDRFGLSHGFGDTEKFSQFSHDRDMRERESAFQDKVRDALRDVAQPSVGEADRDGAKLIASAGMVLSDQAASVQTAVNGDAGPAELRADQSVRIDALASRIESGLQAELRTVRPGEFALNLDLGEMGLGFASLSVSLSADRLDIVLFREPGALSPDTLAAAQALADRLHQRFAKKVVRIHEAEATEPKPSGDGMSAIASLFRRTEPSA